MTTVVSSLGTRICSKVYRAIRCIGFFRQTSAAFGSENSSWSASQFSALKYRRLQRFKGGAVQNYTRVQNDSGESSDRVPVGQSSCVCVFPWGNEEDGTHPMSTRTRAAVDQGDVGLRAPLVRQRLKMVCPFPAVPPRIIDKEGSLGKLRHGEGLSYSV